MKYLALACLAYFLASCSPITSTQHDEKYKWELTLHEVQTNLDDLRHDTHCMVSEMQILDTRLKAFESQIEYVRYQELQNQRAKLQSLEQQIQNFEAKTAQFEKKVLSSQEGLDSLSLFAKETSFALSQFKSKIEEIEGEMIDQSRRLETFARLKENIQMLSKSLRLDSSKIHKVKSGETLEKIAKHYKTDVAQIKEMNQLNSDLIVIDQELKIP